MRIAIDKANKLDVPLIVAGDLHDTKANLRGECITAMLKTFRTCDYNISCYILRGNHDAINEKSKEHSLTFLPHEYDGSQVRQVITEPTFELEPYGDTKILDGNSNPIYLIPYHHDADELRAYLKTIPKGSTLIMHQGLQGSNMGDYFQDKSAINHEDVKDFRVISGHYHAQQHIVTDPKGIGFIGTFSYIGNPYTTSYGEANDPPKGFQILMDDGSLEFVPTNLRKHVVYEVTIQELEEGFIKLKKVELDDLLWVKLTGTREELVNYTKQRISDKIKVANFRLDLIPLDTKSHTIVTNIVTSTALFDSLIDNLTNTSDTRKLRLKELYKHLGS